MKVKKVASRYFADHPGSILQSKKIGLAHHSAIPYAGRRLVRVLPLVDHLVVRFQLRFQCVIKAQGTGVPAALLNGSPPSPRGTPAIQKKDTLPFSPFRTVARLLLLLLILLSWLLLLLLLMLMLLRMTSNPNHSQTYPEMRTHPKSKAQQTARQQRSLN